MLEAPLDVNFVTLDLLLPLEPKGHLPEFVFFVSSTVRVLGKVDMQTFRILGIVVVRGTKQFYGACIMVKGVEFREMKVLSYAKSYEDELVRMESMEGVFEKLQCMRSVRRILCEVEYI